jgi:hypothetical protein
MDTYRLVFDILAAQVAEQSRVTRPGWDFAGTSLSLDVGIMPTFINHSRIDDN